MKTICVSILAISLVALSSCSTHKSTLRTKSGAAEIYVLDESLLFNCIYNAVSEIYPKHPVFDIDGPIRGFHVTRAFGPDYYTTMVRIFPAIGYSKSGQRIEGYYYEVSGKGTYFDGPAKDRKLFEGIGNELRKYTIPQLVINVQRGVYKLDRDRWKLRESEVDLSEDSDTMGQSQSIKDRLMKLEELYRSGLITQEEYEFKRSEILSEL